ncbi:unnamed protein product [Brassica rapa subsp. narinosa]
MAGVLLGTAIVWVKIINMLLRCQQAIQLNEISSYAHMLSGHEPVYISSKLEKNRTSWKLK